MDLIPAPRTVSDAPEDEFFVLGPDTVLAAGPGAERAERWLRSELGAATGHRLAPGDGSETDAIRITVAEVVADDLGPEGYRIMVSPTGVHLHGGGPAGVFWGAQTLRQLLGPEAFRRAPLAAREWHIPFCHIEDSPRFGWRGLMLDVSRHFLPKDAVLRYVDLMAAHKLNVLHLHLTDDQGWRVEIKRYPRLTEVGAWRERTKVGLRESERWDERPHGGYYTQDDIREIVSYAAQRHITVVPEIDIPGHSQAAIAAYPELGNADVVDTGALPVLTSWGVNPNVLAPSDGTLRFYEGVFTELLDLFPSEFFHIGGDECPKEQWRASASAQERIKELGLADEDELQSWIIRHFDGWLAERGRRLIGWDEILEGGLAPGAAVSSWRGYAGGIAAARAGHDVVMCPESHVYLDWRQSDLADEPVPIARVRTLEDVYRFEPVPAELTEEQAAHVIGTQANAWTEVMDSPRVVDYMVFPRLAAVAEVAWSRLPAPAERDWPDFERRMKLHYARLDALGVEYRPPGGPLPWQRRPGVVGRPIDGEPPIV
ncbi:beta-N-acetylhexosaminidase [Streptomyces sp. H39-S7]|uniref:beta-N-acetylhexosaminidase n=1 Tax=Streptomyces sp. H39-S7 TaxID=3004357 RepID=UPI0022B065CE|nr:beta-N-acetylhexosaminidase [Streptomyces sp. H39-S7]MCZ4118806.1 beta-N-acetylhexosaminidase [Streptomyces sp. H39-S7]